MFVDPTLNRAGWAFSLLLSGGMLLAERGLVNLARADVFVLANEAEVRGELLNPREVPRKNYVVQTESGEVTLAKDQVVKVIREPKAAAEYERLRPTFADTVEGQWEAAEWCREHKLSAARETHMRRVLELDPEHSAARRALGYSKIGGRWTTREEHMAARGFVEHEGKWVLPQELQLLQEREESKTATLAWKKKIGLLRSWLRDGSKAHKARAELLAIRDAYAIGPLQQALSDEPDANRRLLLVEVLGNMGEPAAISVLIERSLVDSDEEVRHTSLDFIERNSHPDVTGIYVKALRSKQNVMINRAGRALARLKDPSAVGPLIDSLVTNHKFKVTSGSGGTSAGMVQPQGGGGGGGFFQQGQKTTIHSRDMENESVRDALIQTTGQNFQYDQDSWRRWYRTQRKDQGFNARRDGV